MEHSWRDDRLVVYRPSRRIRRRDISTTWPKKIVVGKQDVAVVPIGGRHAGKFAYIGWADYTRLVSELGISPYWNIVGNNVLSRNRDNLPVSLARFMMDAGPGERVVFIDGNGLNLLRANLQLTPGYGKHETRKLGPKTKVQLEHELSLLPTET